MVIPPFVLEIDEFSRSENVYRYSNNPNSSQHMRSNLIRVCCRLVCRWYSTIRDIKQQINSITKQPHSRLHLFHSSRPYELTNSTTLHDLGIEGAGYSMKLAVDYEIDQKFTLEVASGLLLDEDCRDMLQEVRIGLDRNRIPGKTDVLDSTGGVYFMRSHSGAKAAVFKPRDEEQGMEGNAKGYTSPAGQVGLRPYFKPGYGCLREVAAYLFDVDNFCSVPCTTLVHCEHPVFNYPRGRMGGKVKLFPKLGSLQKFIHGESFEDIGASKLSDLEVQKIALFDLRVLNGDRNANNILAVRKLPSAPATRRNSDAGLPEDLLHLTDDEFDPYDTHLNVLGGIDFQLIPIDHGYAFPPKLTIYDYDWTWLNYPQIGREVVPEIREYMDGLDIDGVLNTLRENVPEISEDTLFLLRVSHLLIKEGIAAGLNLKDIASLVARLDEDEPSKLEQALRTAEDNATSNMLVRSARTVCKRLAVGPVGRRAKRSSAPGLSAVDVSERESPLSSSSEEEGALRRVNSLYSSTDYASVSPVSITHKPSLSASTDSDLSRESSSDSLVDVVKGAETEDLSLSCSKGFAMARVASFAGFDSASVVDLEKKNSMHSTSHQTQRKRVIASTSEFKQLKWKLATDGVRAMIARAKKAS